jgi:hypothetical protein
MKEMLYLARKGLIVRDPVTRKPLAEEGEMKMVNTYWLRRIKDGDVVRTKTIEAPAEARPVQEGPAPKRNAKREE